MRITRFDPSGKTIGNSPSHAVFFRRAVSKSSNIPAHASGAMCLLISSVVGGLSRLGSPIIRNISADQ